MSVTEISILIGKEKKSHFTINGSSPDPRGKLARFAGEPFERWKGELIQILDETYGEDGYRVAFHGNRDQFEALQAYADRSDACKSCFFIEDPADNTQPSAKATVPYKGAVAGAVLYENRPAEIVLPKGLFVGESADLQMTGISPEEIDFEYLLPNDDSVVSCRNGRIEARKAGRACVRCKRKGTVDEYLASGEITVYEHRFVTDIIVTNAPSSLYVGERMQLYVDLLPENAENAREIHFTSADESVLRVSQSGRVSAVGPGEGCIEVSVDGGNKGPVARLIHIQVLQKLRDIWLSELLVSGNTGQSIPVNVELIPQGFTEKDIRIQSDDPSVATYKNGRIRIHGPGETDIRFISDEAALERTLHVVGTSTFRTRNMSDLPVQIGIAMCLLMFVMRVVFSFNVPILGFLGAGLCILSLFIDRSSRISAGIFTVLNLMIALWFMGAF